MPALSSRPGPSPWALALRVLSLLIALSQAAIPLYSVADPFLALGLLVCAALSAYAFARVGMKPAVELAFCALLPLAVRALAFLGLSAFAALRPSPGADRLFMAFDDAFMPTYLPALWMGLSSIVASRSLAFLRMEPIANAAVFAFAFWSESGLRPQKYAHPSLLALAAGSFILCEAARLALAERTSGREARRRAAALGGAVLPLLILLFLFMLGEHSERATASGGGLIKPTLSRFDFSRYLKLESEISLSKDLVLLVKKDSQDPNILLRRHILSGYDARKGFFSEDVPWVEDLPATLPNRPAEFGGKGWKGRERLEQEYYVVNFDPGSFIAMNDPESCVPLGNWESSSFKSIYRVVSAVPGPALFLGDFPQAPAGAMDGKALAYYTGYGNDGDILALAESVAGGDGRARAESLSGRYALARRVEAHLRSAYRYSLKPGVAEDGNQLRHFLFVSKKGYCSYFAFAMTLMLRSLGVPARVAVGFFVDPGTDVLSLYPVRADMAHAWVEVFFPGYGWLEFDPTSDQVAEGENLELGDDIDPEQYARLIQEILRNRESLVPREGPDDPAGAASKALRALGAMARAGLSRWYLSLPALLLILLALRKALRLLPLLLSRGPRRKAIAAFSLALSRRSDSGFRRRRGESQQEYCRALDAFCGAGSSHLELSLARDQAMYGPEFGAEEKSEFDRLLKSANAAFGARLGRPRAMAAFLFLPTVRRRPRAGAAAVLLIALCAASLSGQAGAGGGAPGKSAAAILDEAEAALAEENFDRAASLLKSGQAAYPGLPEFPRKLGYLYYDKELYSLAMDEFRRAERLDPADASLVYTMSDALGRLNREEDSIAYLKRTLELDPSRKDAVSDLGWMYFKVHKTEEGIAALKKGSEEFGFDEGFEMTLGTLYSDRYDYDQSKRHYEAAIEASTANGDMRFAGVAYYNLSILESKFYRFPEAVKLTEKSIEHYDRASAHLARGELAQKSLDLERAKSEYEIAFAYDTSPLSSVSLAGVALAAGELEKARSIAEENLKRTDHSWMVNFGTDLDNHAMDLYGMLKDAYAGLARMEARRPASGIADRLSSWAKAAEYAARAWYCERRYRGISFGVSQSYRAAGNALLADVNCYNALEGYPGRALPYLRRARDFEGALVPESLPSYELEEALLLGDVPRALAAADGLSLPWESETLCESLARAGRILSRRGGGEGLRAIEERIFALNRGAILQAGLRLPAILEIEADDKASRRFILSSLKPVLSRAGFDFRPAGEDPSRRYRLRLSIAGGFLAARLEDSRSSRVIASASGPSGGKGGSARENADRILKACFRAD